MDVEALWRYPIKSMGGEQVTSVAIGTGGIDGDRSFAVIDATDATVASAKQPRKWGSLLQFAAAYPDGPDGPVRITFPDGSTGASDDADIDARLSSVLGRPVRLSAQVPTASTYEAEWPEVDGVIPDDFLEQVRTGPAVDGGTLTALATKPGTFQDFAAVHLVAASTLRHLADLAPDVTFGVSRFRPNIVVGGADGGFVENTWTADLGVGEAVVLRPVIPTMRCIMTTLGQRDLPRDTAVLRTVAAHNRLAIPGFGTWSCVGLYAEVGSPGVVNVGDRVT